MSKKFLSAITLDAGAVVGGVFEQVKVEDVLAGGTVTSVNLTAPAAGITVAGGPITTAGSIALALANDLAALEAMAGTGLVARTASETYQQRALAGTTNRLTVTNGDGVAGNPTLDVSAAYVGQTTITSLGTVTTGVWHGTIVGTLYGGTGLDGSAAANGKLLIGNGSGFALATLTQGAGVTITNGAGTITIAASGGMTIGSPVSGGTANDVLFVDGSGNLAQSAGMTFDGARLVVGAGAAYTVTLDLSGPLTVQYPGGTVTLGNGTSYAATFSNGTQVVVLCDGTNHITYVAGNSANWAGGTPPTDVWVGIDRCAAALAGLGAAP